MAAEAMATRSQTVIEEAVNRSIDGKFASFSEVFDGKISVLAEKLDEQRRQMGEDMAQMFQIVRQFTEGGQVDRNRASSSTSPVGNKSSPLGREPEFNRQTTQAQNGDRDRFRAMEDWQEWRSCNNRSAVFPCPDFCEDPIFKLKKLEQRGGIKEYYEAFDLIQRSVDLPEEFLLNWFIAGLKIDTRTEVRKFRPRSVSQAYGYGRFHEIAYPKSIAAVKSRAPAPSSPLQSVSVQELSSSAPIVIIQDSTTSFDSSLPFTTASLVKNQATTSATKAEFQNPIIRGKSSTCQIVENLGTEAIGDNLNSVENKNREEKLRIVKVLAESGIEDEYSLENKEIVNSDFRAPQLFDKMSEPVLGMFDEMVEIETDIGELFHLIESHDGVSQWKMEKGNYVFGAHKVFDQMSGPSLEFVFVVKTLGSWVLEDASFPKHCVHCGMFDTFAFDPGGRMADGIEYQVQESNEVLLLKWASKLSGIVASNVFAEMPTTKKRVQAANRLSMELSCLCTIDCSTTQECLVQSTVITKLILHFRGGNGVWRAAEVDRFWLWVESFVVTIFDPRGAYVLLKCGCGTESCSILKLPIHWDPGAALFLSLCVAVLDTFDDQKELCATCL